MLLFNIWIVSASCQTENTADTSIKTQE